MSQTSRATPKQAACQLEPANVKNPKDIHITTRLKHLSKEQPAQNAQPLKQATKMLSSSSLILAIIVTGQLCQGARLGTSRITATAQINDSQVENITNREPPLQIDTDESLLLLSPREFHFGAKIAISLLLATVTLVALATLVDCQTDERKQNSGHKRREASSPNGRLLFGKRESGGGLRDYRSLSMSSNCSSNLFCSTSSVASSSTPIHQTSQTACNQSTTRTSDCWPASRTGVASERQHFESNLQLHFNDNQPSATLKVPLPQQFAVNKLSAHLSASHLDCGSSSSSGSSSGGDCGASTAPSRHELVGRKSSSGTQVAHVAKQILLAFSLRQSARQIFSTTQEHAGGKSTGADKSPDKQWRQSADDAHQTMPGSSLTCDDDYVSAEKCQTNKQSTSRGHECVDSLHGLRFLSMIWVIVIHSYNFALRWMFFSNATTLDGIYKTAASQLIANGSFACDSFFFAGGFLLPYLAFASDNKNNNSSPDHCQGTVEEQQAATATAASTKLGEQQAPAACSHNAHQRQGDETTTPSKLVGEDKSTSGSTQLDCCSNVHVALVGANIQARAQANTSAPISTRPHHDQRSTSAAPNQVSKIVATATTNGPQSQAREQPYSVQCESCEQEQNTNELGERAGRRHQARDRRGASQQQQQLTLKQIMLNILHRYIRMMPLMMAIIGLCSTLMRYLGEGPVWNDSTMMYDGWCRKNWWINAMFLHNFVNRENMCLSHSWYSAVDLQLFLVGQLVLFALARSRKLGLSLLIGLIVSSQLITVTLTIAHHLPAVPLVSSVNEQTMNLYYGQIYIKPYCRGSPYFIGILLAYLMRTTKLGQLKLKKWQALTGWLLALGAFASIILAMQPAMNGRTLSELESALYSALSRPLWALATGWMIFACITKQGGLIGQLLGAKCFIPLSRLTYPAFLIHPIVMALFYGSRQASFHFSHYLMLYLILGNIVITYASAFILAALFELPLLSIERTISRLLIGGKR